MDAQQQGTEQTVVETQTVETAQRTKRADITPYAVHKMVNVKLEAAGVDVQTTSQSLYSRAIKGVIKSYKDANGKWWCDGDDAARWMKQYVDGYVNGTTTQSRTDFAKLAEQY